ncbi:hypothetical protein E2C01_062722 [Portunus trituberculatus]|uniref:Uncharacterized protein n=1 Tax=Portunus trituberculatus TaxID=210409 RepID=A0A5B7H8P2_PORTR|nr:hypothetical protein [Portunus trituberculatus]
MEEQERRGKKETKEYTPHLCPFFHLSSPSISVSVPSVPPFLLPSFRRTRSFQFASKSLWAASSRCSEGGEVGDGEGTEREGVPRKREGGTDESAILP